MKRISQRDMLQSEIARLTVELNGQKAEVERLRLMVQSITGGLDEAVEAVHYLEAENALLRKVVDAAREFISSTGCDSKECKKCDPKYIGFCMWSGIGRALAELDNR